MQPGDIVDNKYRIETQLGEGGMGRVLAATHVTLDSTFAIKILKKDALSHPDVTKRFMREARAASKLRNEHVVRVSDIGQLPSGEPYMVMEMLHGYDLATRLQKGPLEPARAVEYIVQACEGLAEAHAHGMVHRDIKPANLFVTTRPNGAPLIKVLDFGIATAAIGDVDHRLTTTQSVIGSPSYMSPEQLRATRDVDARSDIWSLGVTLYELLADRQPFVAPTITALSLKIVSEPHVPIEGIPDELMAIIDRCLEKERDARFASVAELAAALAPLFPNGKLAAEMVSGMLSNPVPPTLPESSESAEPSEAHWRMPSAPGVMTTTGFTAGESAALTSSRKRRTGWIALAAAAAAGGIATAAVLGLSSRSASSTPAPSSAASAAAPIVAPTPPPVPPPIVEPAPPPEAPPVVEPVAEKPTRTENATTPSKKASRPRTVEATKATSRPRPGDATKPTSRRRPGDATKPTSRPRPDDAMKPSDVTKPAVDPPKPPPVVEQPPPPKKPKPCDPSDKTCGL